MYVKQPVGPELVKEWGLEYDVNSTTNFWDKEGWGNLIGGFKLYRSLTKIYTKEQQVTDENGNVTGVIQVTDVNRTALEIILMYIESAKAAIAQLRIFRFRDLPEYMQYYLRSMVQRAIQENLNNRTIMPRTTQVEVQGSGINMAVSPQQVLTTLNWFGERALEALQLSGILEMDIIGYDEPARMTRNGNKVIIAKFDETKIEDLNP